MITLKKISKHYFDDLKRTKKTVIKDLNLEFESSKTTGVMGHNGAGKTTLIRMILGLAFPTQGTILLDGRPISRQDRHRLGYLPETDHLNLQLTPREILSYHLRLFRPLHPTSKETIQSTLIQTGLIDHADRKSNLLSKGQRRRIAWSQAMIHNPDLIILDEPFSGLDPQGRDDMSKWILETKTKSKTIILCTHDTKLTHYLCDNIFILRSGQCVWRSNKNQNTHYQIELKAPPKNSDSLPAPDDYTQKGPLHLYSWFNQDHAYAWLQACKDQRIEVLSFTTENLPSHQDKANYFKPDEASS